LIIILNQKNKMGKEITVKPRAGKYLKGIWIPANPNPLGMTQLEKYQEACKIALKMEKLKVEYTQAREKYRSISQQLGQLLTKQQEYLK